MSEERQQAIRSLHALEQTKATISYCGETYEWDRFHWLAMQWAGAAGGVAGFLLCLVIVWATSLIFSDPGLSGRLAQIENRQAEAVQVQQQILNLLRGTP